MAKRILLADDSLTIHRVVELTFAEEDFELYTAKNGQEALAKTKEVNPDLIITDVNMPEMDGYDLCREVKEDPALSHIPVILLKGTFEPFDVEKAKSVRYDAIISKPFQSSKFVAKVKEVLSSLEPKVEPPPAPAVEVPSEELDSEKGMPIVAPEKIGEEQVKVEEELNIGEEKELEEALYRLEEPSLEEEQELLQLLEEEEEGEVSKLAPELERAEMPAESLEEEPSPPGGIEPGEVKTEEELEEIKIEGPEEIEAEKPEIPLVEEIKEEAEAPLLEEEVAIPGEGPEEVETEEPPEAPLVEETKGEAEAPLLEEEVAIPGEGPEEVETEEPPEAPLVEETKGEAEAPLIEEKVAIPGEQPEEVEVPTEKELIPPVEEPAREAKPIALSVEEIETVVRRVVEQMSDKVIREVAWEVIPELAEELIKKAIAEIKKE